MGTTKKKSEAKSRFEGLASALFSVPKAAVAKTEVKNAKRPATKRKRR